MLFENLDNAEWILMTSVAGLILCVWCMGILFWYRRRTSSIQHLEQRLATGEAEVDAGAPRVLRLWNEGRETTITVRGEARRGSWWDRLDQPLEAAGWTLPPATLLFQLLGGIALVSTLIFFWTGSWLPAAAAAIASVALFRAYLGRCISRRAARFESQLVDALELAARSLRSGHPLFGAFRLIAEEIPEPVGRVFTEIGQQHELGRSQEEAIRNAAAKSTNDDLKLFATSVAVQLRSGGNLADMMERLARVIRDRLKVRRRIRVLTAQTQLSKRVLVSLPFIMFAVLNIVNADYVKPLYVTALGQTLLVGAGVSILVGITTMNHMTKLRY